MPDENDILFNEYSLDFFAFLDLLFARFLSGASGSGDIVGPVASWSPEGVFAWLSSVWGVLVVLSWIVSALLLFGLIYAYIRHEQLGEVVAEILKRQEEAYAKIHQKDVKNLRWRDVQNHIGSDRPSDWKLAIIEADILLGELLDTLGYAGTTIGDKLKSVSPNSFSTVNQAWRAHNVRNRVAHEGGDFDLSKKSAQETIAQYKMVFDEFDFI